MKDYQRIKQTKYILPRATYFQALWTIRDYNRLKEECEEILHESPSPADGQPKGTGIGDPVAAKAFRREKGLEILKAIDRAKGIIPEEYISGIWKNIQYGEAMPLDASRATYGRWKSRFVFEVAKNLFLI